MALRIPKLCIKLNCVLLIGVKWDFFFRNPSSKRVYAQRSIVKKLGGNGGKSDHCNQKKKLK